jgi:hypothetical protein
MNFPIHQASKIQANYLTSKGKCQLSEHTKRSFEYCFLESYCLYVASLRKFNETVCRKRSISRNPKKEQSSTKISTFIKCKEETIIEVEIQQRAAHLSVFQLWTKEKISEITEEGFQMLPHHTFQNVVLSMVGLREKLRHKTRKNYGQP